MAAVCEQPDPPWSGVVEAHDAVHHALVAAAQSPRILRAYEALAGEMRLFVIRLKPSWSLDRMAEHHERLLADLEREGPGAAAPAPRRGLASVVRASTVAASGRAAARAVRPRCDLAGAC